MRHEVEWMAHEVTIEDCNRRSTMPYHRMRKGCEMSSLALVHRQIARLIQQALNRDSHEGIIGKRKRPRLSQIRHHQHGRGLQGSVIEPCGVAVDERKGAH